MKIPIARTSLLKNEIESVLKPLNSGWLVQGSEVRDFETKWTNFTSAKNSIAVTSCTSGLDLCLSALNLKPGDEVIVPAFTWISSANVVEHHGAKVVFCDISLDTFNIDENLIEKLITKKTRGIIPVHLFGLPANMDKINELAHKYNIWVVEDAACGFGSFYKGKHVGTLGDLGCFSFHPRKAITTGEGGMVCTNDDTLAKNIIILRDHGAEVSDLQRHLGPKPYILSDHTMAGYNQRMTDIQGALGSSQMDRAYSILKERRRLAEIYNIAFKDFEWLSTPHITPETVHGFQSYACIFDKKNISLKNVNDINTKRNNLMDFLQSKGVSTRPGTHAVHMLTYYKEKYNLRPQDFPNAYFANDCSISLPLFHGMKQEEQSYVIETMEKFKK